jgi:hypothetical protein
MFCEGVFVDEVKSLAATVHYKENKKEPIEPEPEADGGDIGPYLIPVDETSRLALARVLCHDSYYDFTQGLSLLDVPWPIKEELRALDNSGAGPFLQPQDSHNVTEGVEWPSLIGTTSLNVVFRTALFTNAAYLIHGIALRHYFTSTETFCTDPQAFNAVGKQVLQTLGLCRLCNTGNDLLGMAPKYARPNDRIAVLLGCDMPVVLRPKGDHYELIGGCFIEGLMKGEAIASVEMGDLHTESISIC